MTILWTIVKSRWFWMATTILISIVYIQKPRIVVQEKIVTRDVIKWKVKASVSGGTTTVDSGGNISNVGGTVVVDGSGSSESTTIAQKTEKPADKWKVIGGLAMTFPEPNWQISIAYNIGHILFLDMGLGGVMQTTSLTDFAPDRYGAGVIVSF